MARRRKTSLFNDLFTLATLLPWWASLLVALASWYLLHGYATSPIPPVDPHRSDMTGAMFRGLAMVLWYLTHLASLCVAICLIAKLARRKKLFDRRNNYPSPKSRFGADGRHVCFTSNTSYLKGFVWL